MLSSAFADGPFPRGHSRSAMKLSQSFHVHGIAPSRNRTKAPRSPVPRHANFSNTLSDAPHFRGRPFPRGHSRSAMKLSQIFRVHGIAPSRNRTKAPHAPAPRQLLKHPSRRHPAFADGPFPRRHTRITKSHPKSSAGSAHAPASPCHASHGRRCRFHWHPFPASRIPAPTPKRHMRQPPANFSSTLPVATPLRGQPFSARSFAQRHENYSKTSMSTASRHLATAPKHRIRQPPPTSQTCFPPLSRTALFRADTHASPRVILNLPQARHMPPRRLVMPATACGVAFIGVPFPRPASPHLLQSVAFASSPPTSQTPSPSPPRFRGRPFPRRHTRITKSHPESSAGSAHAPTPPCHAGHGRRCRFHWRPFPASRIPEPTPKRRMRQPTVNFSNTVSVAPLSRTAPLRTDIRAAPWDPTETSVATAGHPFPAHPRPLPCPLAKNALPAKRGRRPAERYFRDRRLIVRLV